MNKTVLAMTKARIEDFLINNGIHKLIDRKIAMLVDEGELTQDEADFLTKSLDFRLYVVGEDK